MRMNEADKSKIQNLESKIAFVFPGQGSQYVGMGKDLADNFPAAKKVFEEADEALGFPLAAMCFEGNEKDLQLTANTQPAILTTSVAAFRAMQGEGFASPDYVAGHSLGEYSALVANGAIDFAEAVRTVRKRGEYMQDAVPIGVGAMAAILGLDIESVELGCAEAAQGQVCSPANINSPSQVVIAGNSEAVDRACEILKGKGAKRAVKLNVSAPFHCELMLPAAERLQADMPISTVREFECPIIPNVTAEVNEAPDGVIDDLIRQIYSPVKWLESIQKLRSLGVERFVEVGPGKVLTGLLRQIDRDATGANVEDTESLRSTLETL
jgi:[acyl-carrier-protein] S-malonyltransferase